MTKAARLARSIYDAAVNAVKAETLIAGLVQLEGNHLHLADLTIDLTKVNRIIVVGAGKASSQMAEALETVLGDRISDGLIVTKDGHGCKLSRCVLMESSHPVPDERSVKAGMAILELVESAGQNDLVLFLLSGGASALMEAPVTGVTLEEVQQTTTLMLRGGADITALNQLRSCISRVKAGGVARCAVPARVVCLVLSDVLGNPLEIIGSGPCVDIPMNPQAAKNQAVALGVWEKLPASIRIHIDLLCRVPEGNCRSVVNVEHRIVGDLWTALKAAHVYAVKSGLRPALLSGCLQGEASAAGRLFGCMAKDLPITADLAGIDCFIAGGETTVTVNGQGLGGRSQELALAAAAEMNGSRGVALLAAGTDGTDGPTDAAGGIVTGSTANELAGLNFDVQAELRQNNSYEPLRMANCLVMTGPTHTNVGDLIITVFQPEG